MYRARAAALTAACSASIDWFLPAHIRGGDADSLRRGRLVVTFGWTLIALALAFAVLFKYTMGSAVCAAALVTGAGVGVVGLLILRRTGSCLVVGNLLAAAFHGTLTAMACRLSGNGAESLAWYAGVPVVALITAGRRSAGCWFAVSALSFAAFYALYLGGHTFPNDLDIQQYHLLNLLSGIGLTLLLVSLALVYERAMGWTLAELRTAERRLWREKDFSDCTIASLPGIFYLFDDQGKYLRWNENFEQVSGYSAEEIAQMHPIDFFSAADQGLVEQCMKDVFVAGQVIVEASLVNKQGTAIPHLFTGRRLMVDGKPYLVGVGIDTAERQRIAVELARARDEAEAATRAKSEFLANMSHEIRTPMTAILGFSEVLAASVTDAEQLDAVRTIRHNGEYLLKIINDILDLSKIEAGKLEMERVPCSPCQILAEVASLMRVRAKAKNLLLETEYDGPIPESICCDPQRLRQILINLAGNAIKFTETGKVRLVARLAGAAAPMMHFDVIDTGIGMDHQQIAALFQPFSQVDASTTRRHGGTGLGLAISKRLARELGGDLSVLSEQGQGSSFTVKVSAGSLAGVKLLQCPTEAQLPATLKNEPTEPITQLACRVLLAEDGADNQRLIALVLKKAGATVAIVENGQIACDTARAAWDAAAPFDVILMDMQMPVMDGYEATAKLRAAGYSGPIIALTAHAMSPDRKKCLDAGCDDYMTKPIDHRKLVSLVAEYAECGRRAPSPIAG